MKILFLTFVSLAFGSSLADENFKKYEEKLRAYQNLTNLDEDSFNAILKNGLSNRK